MALEKQVIPIPFTAGVDTKSDPKGVPAGKLLVLENGVFTNPHSIGKRPGHELLGQTILNPPSTATTITSAKALAAYASELLEFDDGNLYSYDAGNTAWVYKGTVVSTHVTASQVVRNTANQKQQDSAVHSSGLQCFVWEDSRGGCRYSVVDGETGQTIVADTRIATNEIKPKVFALGNLFVIVWVNTSSSRLFAATVAISNPTAALVPVALTASSGGTQLKSTAPNWDGAVVAGAAGDRLFVFYNDSLNITGGVSAFYLTAANPTTLAALVRIQNEGAAAMTVFPDLYNRAPVFAWFSGGNAVKFKSYDFDLVASLGSGTVEAVANVVSITGVSRSSTALSLAFYYSVSAASTYNYLTRTNTVTGAYSVGTAAVFCRSVALAGKAFSYAGTAYVPVVFESSLQSTYFILNSSGKVAAKLLSQQAGGIPVRTDSNGAAMITESNAMPDGTSFLFALMVKDLLDTQGATGGGSTLHIYTQFGIQQCTLNFFDDANSYLRAEAADSLHLCGGFLQQYDGAGVVEHGFHIYPEILGLPVAVAGHTYQYVVCYEWCDAQGNLHRSAPSAAQTHQQALPIDGGHTVAVSIGTLRVTAKTSPRAEVTLAVYRTVDNGTTFYRATSITSPTFNSTTADAVTFTDGVTDAALQSADRLYTTGGVVENIEPDAVSHLVPHRNRLFALETTTGKWWYSKEILPGTPAEFSDLFTMSVDPRGGASTAGASLDDKFVIFKPTSIFIVTGRGPDSAGGQNDFSDAILVTTDCGCVNPRSIVVVPNGLMFQSQKGIYLLDRGLSVTYIGADVEAYNDDSVTSAQLIASTNQVRFTLSSGVALVFDYLMQQWSVFTPIAAVDSCLFEGKFTYVTAEGKVYRETPGVYSDAGNWIKLRAVTAWLQLAGMQGFQRIYSSLFLGTYVTSHNLHIQVAYDFNDAPTQEDFFTPTAGTAYGEDSVYGGGGVGDSTVYGGVFPLDQVRIQMARQKCEAIQLTIEDLQPGTGGTGEGMNLSGLTLEVGVKRGAYKLPAASSVG